MATLKVYIRKRRRNKSGSAEESTVKSEMLKMLAVPHSFTETPLPSNLHGNEENEEQEQRRDDKQESADTRARVEHSTKHANSTLISNLLGTRNEHLSMSVKRIIQKKKNQLTCGIPCDKDTQLDEAVFIGQHNRDECVSNVKTAKTQDNSCTGAAHKHSLYKMPTSDKPKVQGTIWYDQGCNDKEECLDQETRKKRLRSFAETPSIQILTHRYGEIPLLSPQLLKITRLFTVILSICRFNSAKDMMTIYHKSKKCMENLLNKKVSVADIEQINWLVPDALSFRKIEIMHLGEKVTSFTIEVVKSSPHMIEEKIMQFVKDTQMKRNSGEDVVVPRRALFGEGLSEKHEFSEDAKRTEGNSAEDGDEKRIRYREAEERGRSKALTVLERIREKERMRREDFIAKSREQEEVNILRKRVESYFAVENKKSEKIDRLVCVLCIHNGKEYMKKLCEHYKCFVQRECNGEVFLVLNT